MSKYNKLKILRDYLHEEIGDIVTVIYDSAVGPYANKDRIRIKRDGTWICSIYEASGSDFLFDVIFYDPYTCKSAGYSSIVSLTLGEVPNAIKNRIDIHDGANNNRIDIKIDDNSVQKSIYMMTARGSGKTRWISEMFKNALSFKDCIKDVIFHDPATIVLWNDGSKTVVKCQNGETFDPEKGLAMAISKKIYGNRYDYYEVFNKYVGRYNKRSRKKYIKAIDDVLKEIAPDEIVRDGVVYKRVEAAKDE